MYAYLLSFVVGTVPSSAAEIFVSPTGSADASTCGRSAATACNLAASAEAAGDGDIVTLAAGEYPSGYTFSGLDLTIRGPGFDSRRRRTGLDPDSGGGRGSDIRGGGRRRRSADASAPSAKVRTGLRGPLSATAGLGRFPGETPLLRNQGRSGTDAGSRGAGESLLRSPDAILTPLSGQHGGATALGSDVFSGVSPRQQEVPSEDVRDFPVDDGKPLDRSLGRDFRDAAGVAVRAGLEERPTAVIACGSEGSAGGHGLEIIQARGSVATLRGVVVRGCANDWGGAGLYVEGGIARIEDSVFEDNTARQVGALGAAIAAFGTTSVTVERSAFINNTLVHDNDSGGAALAIFPAPSRSAEPNTEPLLRLSKSVFAGNVAYRGGAVYLIGGALGAMARERVEIDETLFEKNRGFVGGGAVCLRNVAPYYAENSLAVSRSSFQACDSEFGSGGGIVVQHLRSVSSASLTFEGNVFERNRVRIRGAGVAVINYNPALPGMGDPGVFNNTVVRFSRNEFAGNRGDTVGGAYGVSWRPTIPSEDLIGFVGRGFDHVFEDNVFYDNWGCSGGAIGFSFQTCPAQHMRVSILRNAFHSNVASHAFNDSRSTAECRIEASNGFESGGAVYFSAGDLVSKYSNRNITVLSSGNAYAYNRATNLGGAFAFAVLGTTPPSTSLAFDADIVIGNTNVHSVRSPAEALFPSRVPPIPSTRLHFDGPPNAAEELLLEREAAGAPAGESAGEIVASLAEDARTMLEEGGQSDSSPSAITTTTTAAAAAAAAAAAGSLGRLEAFDCTEAVGDALKPERGEERSDETLAHLPDLSASGAGGGIAIYSSSTEPEVTDPDAAPGPDLVGTSIPVRIGNGTRIARNFVTSQGGGLWATGKMAIEMRDGAAIHGSRACSFGGGVFLDQDASLALSDGASLAMSIAPAGAQLFSTSFGALSFQSGSRITMRGGNLVGGRIGDIDAGGVPLKSEVFVASTRELSVTNESISMVCPEGHQYTERRESSYSWSRSDRSTTTQVECAACGPQHYTLSRGQFLDGATVNDECDECPFGAVCLGASRVLVRRGFWAETVEGSDEEGERGGLRVHSCGVTCCNPDDDDVETCELDAMCAYNRTGFMCGSCRDGFTPTQSTPFRCVPDDECSSGASLFALMSVFCIIYVLWLVVRRQDRNRSALAKVVIYFAQAVPFVTPVRFQILSSLMDFASLGVPSALRGKDGFCIRGGATPLESTAMKMAPALVLLLSLVFVMAVHSALRVYVRPRRESVGRLLRIMAVLDEESLVERYTAAATVSALTVFSLVFNTVLTLVVCPTINTDQRLLVSPTFVCYRAWQIVLWLALCLFVFPLPLVLALVLRRHKNSVKEKGVVVAAILNTFTSQFNGDVVYGESILILRRILIVLIARITNDPVFRTVFIAFVMGIFLIVNVVLSPYVQKFDNLVETVALSSLLVLCVLAMRDVTMESFGQINRTLPHFAFTSMDLFVTVIAVGLLIAIPFAVKSALVVRDRRKRGEDGDPKDAAASAEGGGITFDGIAAQEEPGSGATRTARAGTAMAVPTRGESIDVPDVVPRGNIIRAGEEEEGGEEGQRAEERQEREERERQEKQEQEQRIRREAQAAEERARRELRERQIREEREEESKARRAEEEARARERQRATEQAAAQNRPNELIDTTPKPSVESTDVVVTVNDLPDATSGLPPLCKIDEITDDDL